MFKRIYNLGNLQSFLGPPIIIWGGYFIYLSIQECISFFLPVIYFCLAGSGSILYLYKRNKNNFSGMLPPELPAIAGMLLFQPLYFLTMNSFFELQAHSISYELIRQYLSIPVSTLRISALDGTLLALPLTLPVMYLSGLWLRHKQDKSILNESEGRKSSWLRAIIRTLIIVGYLAVILFMIKEIGGPKVHVMNSYKGAEVKFDWGRIYSGIIDTYGFNSIIEIPKDGMESPVVKNRLAGFMFIFNLNEINNGNISISDIRLFEADSGRGISLEDGQSDLDATVEKYMYSYEGILASGVYDLDFNERGHLMLFINDAFSSTGIDLELRFNFKLVSDEFKAEQQINVTTKRGSTRYMRVPALLKVFMAHSEESCDDCLTLND